MMAFKLVTGFGRLQIAQYGKTLLILHNIVLMFVLSIQFKATPR